MSDQKKTQRDRDATAQAGAASARGAGADRDVGHALRSVYSTTVNETVPSELLDLLGKLD